MQEVSQGESMSEAKSQVRFSDDAGMPIEERIGRHVVESMTAGEGPYRRALVSPITFWQIMQRGHARIESGPYGQFITLYFASGPMYVVPNAEIREGHCVFEKDSSAPLVPPGG